MVQEATQKAIGQFDAAVLEIDAEEAEQLAAVDDAMRRLRVCLPVLGKHSTWSINVYSMRQHARNLLDLVHIDMVLHISASAPSSGQLQHIHHMVHSIRP